MSELIKQWRYWPCYMLHVIWPIQLLYCIIILYVPKSYIRNGSSDKLPSLSQRFMVLWGSKWADTSHTEKHMHAQVNALQGLNVSYHKIYARSQIVALPWLAGLQSSLKDILLVLSVLIFPSARVHTNTIGASADMLRSVCLDIKSTAYNMPQLHLLPASFTDTWADADNHCLIELLCRLVVLE